MGLAQARPNKINDVQKISYYEVAVFMVDAHVTSQPLNIYDQLALPVEILCCLSEHTHIVLSSFLDHYGGFVCSSFSCMESQW